MTTVETGRGTDAVGVGGAAVAELLLVLLLSCRGLKTETVGITGLVVGVEGGDGRGIVGVGRLGIPNPRLLQERVETTVAVTGTEVTV